MRTVEAESALFAYTVLKHPGRLSVEIERWVKANMKHRLAFFRTVFQSGVCSPRCAR